MLVELNLLSFSFKVTRGHQHAAVQSYAKRINTNNNTVQEHKIVSKTVTNSDFF